MAEKIYLTPNLREPEFIIVPMGAVNENGIKQKRQAIKFYPNKHRTGQFITSDPKLQAFLDNHEWMKNGKLICTDKQLDSHETHPQQSQAVGPVTSEGAVKKIAPRIRKAK